MSNRLRPLLALLAVSALAGCDFPANETAYPAVVDRERGSIPAAANPPPPPAVPAIGGSAEVPVLASNIAPAGVTQEMVEEGAQLFGTVCSACHGPAGAGTAMAPSLRDAEWLNVSGQFDEIVTLVHEGVPAPVQFPAPMPPMGGGSFTDDEVRAIASYVFALSQSAEGT